MNATRSSNLLQVRLDHVLSIVLGTVGVGVWLFMMFIEYKHAFLNTMSLGWWGHICSHLRYAFKPQAKSSLLPKSKAPGVSILRPLKGVDANLKENLASSFRLVYPNYEILFSVADLDDPAIQVVKDLSHQYPHVQSRLFIGETNIGVNPKVNNMMSAYNAANHDIIWILDSNISVTPNTLGRAVDCLNQPNVGLVHHIPIGVRPESLGPAVEQVFLNACHAKLYTMINKLRLTSCVIGKSNMFRKTYLERIGGLAHYGKFMSEDNIIGQSMWDQGWRHEIPADVVYQPLGNLSLSDFLKRRARWTRIRKFTILVGTLVEPFSECFLNGAMDVAFGLVIDGGMVTDNFPRFLVAWMLREVTALPVYLYAYAGSHVEWRGKPFKLKSDGTVVPCPPASETPESIWSQLFSSMKPIFTATPAARKHTAFQAVYSTLRSPTLSVQIKLWTVLISSLAAALFVCAIVFEFLRSVWSFDVNSSTATAAAAVPGIGRSDDSLNVVIPAVLPNLPTNPPPLWEQTACYMSGCQFSGRRPTFGEAWTAMFVSLVDRAQTHTKQL
ncbi:hypothetical protein CcCBS67573_g03318 [Chytriomyces confervae]|uniref:Ceramide glucosyltransferase n=1 Tax=Chytriomyces confervae TaxID=246404 RepID=A0A507FG97_9FUNG|nr:hypothetical protein CcCBS67573_g03318 [Chytriomyces confervae]